MMDRAAVVFTLAVLLHGADHVRRGIGASGKDVFVLGAAGAVVEVAIVMAIARRHPLAPAAAAAGGSVLAAGYVAAHFLPRRALFSDPLASAPAVTWLSWAAASIEVAAALALAAAGAVALFGRPSPNVSHRPIGAAEVIRRPYVAAMVLGNVVIVVAALVRG